MIRVALIAAFSFALALHSRADDVQFPVNSQLITWEQLQKLSPDRREAYVEELRILMMEIEELQLRRGEIDPQLHLSSHVSFDILKSMLEPRAAALDRSCMGPVFVRNNWGMCVTRASQVAWDRPTPSLFGTHGSGSRTPYPLFGNASDRYAAFFRAPAAPRSGSARAVVCERNITNWDDPLGLKAYRRELADVRRERARTGQAPRTQTARPAQERRPASRPHTTAARRASNAPSGAPESVAPQNVSPPAPFTPAFDQLRADSCRQDALAAAQRTGLVCDRASIDKARKDFDGTEEETCIYGGNFRPYKDHRAQPGHCKPIHQWCFHGPEEKKDEDDCQNSMDPAQRLPTAFNCKPNQILCNPVLFGVQDTSQPGANRFQPYCAQKTGAVTQACYKLVHSDGVDNPPPSNHVEMFTVDGDKNTILNRLNISQDEIDRDPVLPDKIHSQVAAIKLMWRKLAQNLNKMCFAEGPTRQVFCEECSWIRKRLVEMNRLLPEEEQSACLKLVESKDAFFEDSEKNAALFNGSAIGATTTIAPVDPNTGQTPTNGAAPARAPTAVRTGGAQ